MRSDMRREAVALVVVHGVKRNGEGGESGGLRGREYVSRVIDEVEVFVMLAALPLSTLLSPRMRDRAGLDTSSVLSFAMNVSGFIKCLHTRRRSTKIGWELLLLPQKPASIAPRGKVDPALGFVTVLVETCVRFGLEGGLSGERFSSIVIYCCLQG
jgi:hypothetical protein